MSAAIARVRLTPCRQACFLNCWEIDVLQRLERWAAETQALTCSETAVGALPVGHGDQGSSYRAGCARQQGRVPETIPSRVVR